MIADYFACVWSQESARVFVTPVASGTGNGPFVSIQQALDFDQVPITPHVCFDFRKRFSLDN